MEVMEFAPTDTAEWACQDCGQRLEYDADAQQTSKAFGERLDRQLAPFREILRTLHDAKIPTYALAPPRTLRPARPLTHPRVGWSAADVRHRPLAIPGKAAAPTATRARTAAGAIRCAPASVAVRVPVCRPAGHLGGR